MYMKTAKMQETINIIGAGIGGLTTALTLQKKGIKVAIYESAVEIKPVGAGIIIANNAMQVFKKLGLQDKIEKAGNKISCMKITNQNLEPLSVIELSDYEKKYGVHNTAIHRGELQKILADEVGHNNINLSKKLAKIEKNEIYKLTFEDNSTLESKVVIGADGIKSVVRNQLFKPSTLRNAKQKCWRGICEIDLPVQYHHELNEAWGKGKRFGFVKISAAKVYWFALTNSKNNDSEGVNLEEQFAEFHTDILKIIAATTSDQIISSDIIDLKPIEKWSSENVCLIGDAAHATTPNLGQGACQAIEDAYVLGRVIDGNTSIAGAFKEFEKIRRKKALKIVDTSWKLGKIAQLENNVAIWLRNSLLSVLPDSANRKQMDMVFKLDGGE